MAQTVSEILVQTLSQIGVKQIFGLIGDSLNPIGDAIQKSNIEWIGVRHEEGAALAAAGQAKLTGKLGVCAGTTGPGSTHLVAGLYEAARDHAPVLALSGDMPRKMQGIDFIQTTKPDLLFKDVSIYTETISTGEQAPTVIHQAIAAAYARRGVAHLTLPQDVLTSKIDESVISVDMLKPRSEITPSEEDIELLAKEINKAEKIVILCGNGCQGLSSSLCELSDKLNAPLIHTVKAKDIFPYDEPRWMGGLGMIGTKASYYAVMHSDLLLMIGTDYPYSEFLPKSVKTIQIDECPEVMGRRTPTSLAVIGSARMSIALLFKYLKQKKDRSFFDEITEKRKKWDSLLDKQASLTRSEEIHPQAVARTVSDLAKNDAVFILDTGLNTLWSGNWIRQKKGQRILGSFNNAAIGTAMGQANGIQVLDRKRQVIALCGDGGFNMLMCEFLTAVHHELPVKVIIYNNSSFGLISLEAESVGLVPFKNAIQFPNPDFAGFAQACGGTGYTVKNPKDLKTTLQEALSVKGPVIVDVSVVCNEIPNLPHLPIKKIENVALAKVKEAINYVRGF